ncbi:AAA family ATPase [Limnohabitans planktonicus]|nr:ATP-binding protein [Limnohabitans planktonicus]
MAKRKTLEIGAWMDGDLGVQGAQPMLPIVKTWVFRILIELRHAQTLLARGTFRHEDLLRQLGLGPLLTEQDENKCTKSVIKAMRESHSQAEQTPAPVPPILVGNVKRIADLVGLNDVECRILEFVLLMRYDAALNEVCETVHNIRLPQLIKWLSTVLRLPPQAISLALHSKSALARSGLITIDNIHTHSLSEKFDLLCAKVVEPLFESDIEPVDWIKDRVHATTPGHLKWADYEHVKTPVGLLRAYLHQVVAQARKGVNILVYGPPGTGKTQLAKLLASDLGCELFEIATEDEDGDPIKGSRRVKAHCAAGSFFGQRRALILFDESEDVFPSTSGWLSFLGGDEQQQSQRHKGWMNRVLENNALPTVWVSNSVSGLDAAYVRRFDMVLELPVPPKSHRERIVAQASAGMLPAQSIQRLAESEHLSPAVVSRVCQVVQTIAEPMQPHRVTEAVELLVNNTLQAQGHPRIAKQDPHRLPEVYDPTLVNTEVDLTALATQLAEAKSGRLCFYGPPGTGKTAYGRWLAQQLGVPLHVKRASDLLGMYVGENEKNIARAFEQAQEEQAVLLIDEVDSFLQDRQGAQRSWEVSLVNEMLTQMEGFGGVFIASTNLMTQLDPAVLRRFDMKVHFGYLRPQQAAQLLLRHCQQLGLPEPGPVELTALGSLSNLTPGDFAAVHRQSRLRPLRSASDWVKALQAESALKPGAQSTGMGFLR